MDFKNKYSFDERHNESIKIRQKYPDKIPIICQKNKNCIYSYELSKNKYLVPNDLTLGQFLIVIRRRIKINSNTALFLLINNKLFSSSEIISNIYEYEKDKDQFLYITYTSENTFG